jgi:hypothetical protein
MQDVWFTSALLAMLSGMINMAFGAPKMRYLQPGGGVRLIAPDSPEFSALLRELLTADAIAAVQPLLPYSVIVKNEGQKSVVAIEMIWSHENQRGMVVSKSFRQYTLFTTDPARIQPGDARVCTPVLGLNLALVAKRFNMISKADPQQQREYAELFPTLSDITVSLDCVVFDDGQIIGPDTAMTMSFMNGTLRASREALSAMQGSSPEEFKQFLDKGAALQFANVPPPPVRPISASEFEEYSYKSTMKLYCTTHLAGIGLRFPDVASFQRTWRSQPVPSFVPELKRVV